jgi:hypothetical protein
MIKIIQKQKILTNLLILASCTSVHWLATAIYTPKPVVAQTASINLPIARYQQEPFESFLRRVETLAAKTIHNRFGNDASVSELKMVVFGQSAGEIVPVMSVKVSRSAWKASPYIERWATYYPDSKILLGFEQPRQQTTQNPQPQPTPQEEQSPNPPQTPQQPQQQSPIPLQTSPTEEPQQNRPQSPFQRLRQSNRIQL